MLVFDRGFQDFRWWLWLTRDKVWFVTRLRGNAEYGIVEQRPADQAKGIRRDEVILLTQTQEHGPAARLRRIKTFVGTSANAVHIQTWTALIAMLLVRYLQLRSTFAWSLSNLVAPLRQPLFVCRDLMTWLNCPFQPPPEVVVVEQLTLELR